MQSNINKRPFISWSAFTNHQSVNVGFAHECHFPVDGLSKEIWHLRTRHEPDWSPSNIVSWQISSVQSSLVITMRTAQQLAKMPHLLCWLVTSSQ